MFTAADAPTSFVGSFPLRFAFVALTVLIAGAFVTAVYRATIRTGGDAGAARRNAIIAALATALWIGATGALAAAGKLQFQPTPTMLPVLLIAVVGAVGLALSPVGARIAAGLPLSVLVGYQSFRVIVELSMHRAYTEGLMPVQMSFSGRNFDIVTGITAIVLAAWLSIRESSSRRIVLLWNTMGLALLANVVGVALLSAPTPFRVFVNEPANIWITQTPWIWLPTVFVPAAIVGHVSIYRRLLREATRRAAASAPVPHQAVEAR